MTGATEAKLAREAEIAMVTVALATDYDCWKEEAAPVTADAVMKTLAQNAANARKMVVEAIRTLRMETCACHSSLATALVTAPRDIPSETRHRLQPILQKYI
jgi:5'-methylthioadenosine phosphorylase